MLVASQMRRAWPQTICEERDISVPRGQLATQQFCGHRHWKDTWAGNEDEHWFIRVRARALNVNLGTNKVCLFRVNSPFDEQRPSLSVVRVFGCSRPAVLQQQHQILVLAVQSERLHVHGLAELSDYLRVPRGVERLVIGVCCWKIRERKKELYLWGLHWLKLLKDKLFFQATYGHILMIYKPTSHCFLDIFVF